MQRSDRYTLTAISLHWLIALGLVGTFALGFYMHELPLSPSKLKYYSWHKWAGITLLVLAVLRLGWRLTHPAPALPADTSRGAAYAAHAMHWALYGLCVLIPLSGWLMSSAQGFQVVWFGILPLPDLVPKDEDLGETLRDMHAVLNYLLLAAVSLHVAAALKHHFIDRDGILMRMLPWQSRRSIAHRPAGSGEKQ